ncbi:T9SS C-terminal target domain-containing protein [Flavobacterium denitrificans]|uniref:T9SS C-terminal target domain-containing protein n=1 Tax=Flavobacterium denitrificans TaxID=281361 RepID=UPI0004006100|nr:T9SS C-terminal target domain-containing protein [Flavobacterium denitrificans]
MAQFYFFSAFTNFSRKLYLAIILLVLTTVNLNAQNCTVNAGVLNVTICETDALVLTGNNPAPIIGTVKWTQISGPAVVINSPTSSTTTISGYTGGNTYTFRYSATCGDGILSYQDKVVNVKPITKANAGGNIASCPSSDGTLAIIGNSPQNTGETGYWEIVGANNAGVVINFPNLATSTITLPATSCGVSTLQWVIEGPEFAPGQRCRTTSQITVTNYGGFKPVTAGPDQTLSNCYTTTQSTNLVGSYGGCGLNGQNGQWTFVSGPNTPTIGSPNSNNTSISNLTEGTYTFRWTVTGSCASGNDLVVITVPPATQDVTQLPGGDENIFFCDNTINQVTLVAQTPLYAGETVAWSQIEGDPGAIIVSPTNPTTLVTNISSAGSPYRFRYTLTNNNTGCIFTKDYIVQYNGPTRTIVANNGNDIVGSCNATVFTIPLTVTGTGSNQYRIVSGPALSPLGPFPTALQDVGNSLTLTLTAAGDYTVEFIRKQTGALTVECDYGFDTLNILVSGDPTPSNAGTDVSLPCGDTTTILSGVTTDDGLHFWSQLSGPNTAVIADNFAVDTQVSGLISGTYVFQYITKGGGATCGFSVATVTVYVSDSSITNVDAGQDQVVCTNSQVPLTAVQPDSGEIGTWSQVSGPDTITFSNVNDPNAIATGFQTTNSSYELQWTVSYTHPGPSCGSAVSDNVTIFTNNLLAPTQSDAGPDTCYSSGTTTFNLSANTTTPVEFGTWTVQPSTGVIIVNENDPNTAVTVPGNGTYVFTWTIVSRLRNCIPSVSSVSVTVAETPPSADAGPDQEICGTTITMAATQSAGSTGTWTRISGVGNYTISDIHDPNAVFTFNYSGYYIFRWTVDANICGQAFDDINLTIGIPPHSASAGPDQNICNNSSVTMAGNSYDSFFELGQWSVLTGSPNQPTIVDPSNPNTVINGLIAGTYTFRWTITAKSIFLCSGSFDDMVVVVDPAANAGPDQTFCDVTSVQLIASENSKGTWTLTSTTGNAGDVVITQSPPNSYIANATVVPGNDYVFTFTTIATTFPDGSSCVGTSDSVNVTIYNGASIDPNAGPDQTLCISDVGGVTTMSGNVPPPDVSSATWRFVYQPTGSVANIDTPSAPLTTVSNLTVPGLYILEWVFESNNCRTLSDIVRIEMNAPPSPANAGPDDTVACQTTYKTAAVPPAVGIGTWTFASQPPGGNAVIDNPNSPVTTLSNISALGTYTLTWTVTNGPFTSPSSCAPTSDDVEITFNDVPPSIADAGPDQELCNATSATMDAVAVTSGVGTWTQVSGPNTAGIASLNNENSLMLGLIPGTYEFKWTVTTTASTSCISEDTVLVTIYQNPSLADAGPNQIVPQFSPINLNAVAPTIGTATWTQTGGPSTIAFTNPTSPTTAVTGTIPGIYTLQWNVTNGNCAVSTDTMTLTILAVADLELTKTVTPTTGSVGDEVTFNINVFNNNALGGSVTATNVAIRDHIPAGFELVPGSVNSGGIYNVGDNTITWSGITIPSGSILHLSFKATILTGGSYTNIAEVIASDQYDPDSTPNNQNPAEDDQDDATVVLDVADLSLRKTVSPTSVSINDNVTFTISVTNSGPNNATGITVSDHLPSGYTYVSDNGGGKYNNTTGIWNVGNLNNGNTISLQVTAKVNVASAANYVNVAEIQTSHQFDPDSTPGNGLPEDDMSSATVNLKLADLELTKAVSPTSAAAGDQVSFTLHLLNNGPGNATGVAVRDIIPEGFAIIPGSVSHSGFYNVADGSLTWQNLAVANGASIDLTFRATVNPSGTYINIAQVTASDLPDPDSTPNNDDGDQSEDDEANAPLTFIGPTADLELTKEIVAGNTSPVIGSQVSFRLIITNKGPNSTTGVLVRDILPSGYEFVNYSSTDGLYDFTTGIWNVATIDSSASESLIIDAKVLPTGDYKNTTEVIASSLPDPDSTPNNDDGDQSEDDEDSVILTPVQPAADLSLTKTVSNSTPLVGSLVTFQIITTNSGPQDAAQVRVRDLLPSGYTFLNFNSTSGTYDPVTGIWSLDILENTESETLQINATVNPSGDYTNIAEITNSSVFDPDSTPNNGVPTEDDYGTATTTPIPRSSDLSITKTVSNPAPVIGSVVTFQIIVTNNGPQDNTGIQVTDLLPSGYSHVGFTVTTGTYDPTTGVWIIGSLLNGNSETLQIVATVNNTGDYLNIAEVTAADLPDPNSTPNNGNTTENDYASVIITPIVQSSDLSLTKTVNNPTPVIGSQVTFEIILSNNGPNDNTGIEVTDLLPSGYTFVGFNNSKGTYNPLTGLWTIGNLISGNLETLEILATVNATGNYLNVAEVTAADLPDPNSTPNNGVTTEDDYASVSTSPVPQSSDLSITKTVNNATPLVGATVAFQIVVTNNGPNDNTGIQITDLLPSGYTFLSFTTSKGTYNPITGLWTVGNLITANSETLQVYATVNPSGDYTNIAEVTAADLLDPNSTPNNGVPAENDYATATVTPIVQSADLSLTKSVNNATPLVGAPVTFEVVITNNGPQNTTGVTVTDLLPSGYTFSSFTVSTGTYNATTGLWTIGNLPNGASETLQITANANLTGDYLNIAEVSASDLPDPDSTPNNAVTTEDDYATATVTPIVQSADLSLTKSVSNTTPLVGAEVTFEVVVTNNGPQNTTGVTVTDLLPSGYTFVAYRISTGTYTPANGLWTVGNLINGQSETMQLTAIVNATGNYTNIAEITASDLPDPDSTPNNAAASEDDYATATTAPNPQSADLSLTKTVNNATPLAASTIIFEITITNNGPQNTTGVEVTDLLPSGYTFSSYSTTKGSYNSTTGKWNVGSLLNGDTQVLQLSAIVNGTGDYQNIAEVTASALPDPNSTPGNGVATENDYATATITPRALSADLSITKRVNNATPLIGSTVTFEIVLTNNGPQNANGVEVTDLLPSGYTYTGFTATKGTYTPLTGKWNIGSLLSGDAQTLQLIATVNATGNYLNSVEVTASDLPDPNSTPNNGITTENDYAEVATAPHEALADLSVLKTIVGGNFSPIFGSTVTFEITATNSGPQDATGVQIRDLLPSGYEYIVYSATKGQYVSNSGIWNIDSIPNGTTESLLVTVRINRTGNYENTAEVYSSDQKDPDSTPNNGIPGEDDMSTAILTPINAVADLSIEKSVINNILTPAVGSQISFSITVSNSGPSIATGITIKDVLPAGYDYIFHNSTSGNYNHLTGEWNPGIILPGNSHTLIINVFVKTPTGATDEYLNTAEIMTSDQRDPDSTPGNGVATEDDYDSISVTPVIVMADLSISKTTLSGNTNYDVGDSVVFNITVTNDGPGDASGVEIKDLLPKGFKYVTNSATGGVYNFATGIWKTGIVRSGNNESLDIYATINPPSGQANEYLNIAEVTASNLPDPDSTPNNGVTTEDDYDSVQVNVNIADLSLEKTVNNKNANVDEVVTFTLQLGNDGPAQATGVAVEDLIPLGFKNISNINQGGVFSSNTIRWVDLTVPVGGITLTYQATVVNPHGLDSYDYLNIAQVTASNQFDPDSKPNNDNGDQSEDDEDSEFINIPSTDIAITKEVDKTDVPMYSSVVFTITADNLGNLAGTNVEIQDLLPKGYELTSYTVSSGTYDGKTGTWLIPIINARSLQTLTITAKVVDVNSYLNTAHLVKLDQIDTNASNNQDSATVKPNCLKIYNEFSPNDDGQNDTFYIDCITQFPDNQLEVFNRWGNIVYFKKGYDNTWDGKADGSAKTLPEGTYFYVLDLGDGSPKISGWVYIK